MVHLFLATPNIDLNNFFYKGALMFGHTKYRFK